MTTSRRIPRALAVATAALALAGASVPIALGAGDDEPAQDGVRYVDRVGGEGRTATAGAPQQRTAAAIEDRYDLGLQLAKARVVSAPAGDPDGAGRVWTITPTASGGACVATGELAFCGADEREVAGGIAAATEFPPDALERTDAEKGLAYVRPAGKPGLRYGIAPEGATAVRVRGADGALLAEAKVDRGLYVVQVPPEGSRATVEFVGGTARIAAIPYL